MYPVLGYQTLDNEPVPESERGYRGSSEGKGRTIAEGGCKKLAWTEKEKRINRLRPRGAETTSREGPRATKEEARRKKKNHKKVPKKQKNTRATARKSY